MDKPNKRREAINQYIQSKGEVQLTELEVKFSDVSSMTLRRDLALLESRGMVVRIRGGAKSLAQLSMIKEAAYTQRQMENTEAKLLIARKASGLVQNGRSIYIDSGTTCMYLAQQMPDQNLFVLTPAPNIALELVRNSGYKISLTGGQLNRDTLTLSGFNATEYVKGLNIDLAFIGTSSFSLNTGFSCGDFYEAELKKLIIRKSQKVIMLMDSSKINASLPYTFARLKDINVLICDQTLPEQYQKAASRAHVRLI